MRQFFHHTFYSKTQKEKGVSEAELEDRAQERLAKRFAKRARMNRLLEMYCDDAQFSQTRLMDEDEDLRKELKSIRVCS